MTPQLTAPLPATPAPGSRERRNVQAIVELEQSARARSTWADRAIARVAAVAAHPAFIAVHLGWFTAWILYNVGPRAFDRFPFSLLTLVVSLEAILLSVFLLIAQNRMTAEAERRAQLDLQINLLAEQELTAILTVVCQLASKAGVDVSDHPGLAEFQNQTDVAGIADLIDDARTSGTGARIPRNEH